jgi:hypothetical protein
MKSAEYIETARKAQESRIRLSKCDSEDMRDQIIDTMMSDRRTDAILIWLDTFYDDFDIVERIVTRLNERDC